MIRKIIGCLLIASPFITLFAYEVYSYGWKDLFIVIGCVVLVSVVMAVGVNLVFEGKKEEKA